MPAKTIKVDSAAEAYLTLLKDREVDYLFGNAGTDFPSIIEGLSKSLTGEGSAPTPITVPHENLGVAMAHGYYVATGRLASVMVHVNVGTRERDLRRDERRARERARPDDIRPHAADRRRLRRIALASISTGDRKCSTKAA